MTGVFLNRGNVYLNRYLHLRIAGILDLFFITFVIFPHTKDSVPGVYGDNARKYMSEQKLVKEKRLKGITLANLYALLWWIRHTEAGYYA